MAKPSPEEIAQRKADYAKHLAAIASSPSYIVFKEVLEEKQAQTVRVLFSNTPATDAELGYLRGYGAAIRYVIATIEGGEDEFAKQTVKLQGMRED